MSICTPAYQAQDTLGEALASAWAQDLEDFEVVVVDDASTDGTADVLAAQDDPRLRVHRSGRNLGHAGALNLALSLSRGALVKFLDADDALLPGALAALAAPFDRPSVGLAFGRRQLVLDPPDDPAARAWAEENGALHTRFRALGDVNRGPELLAQWLAAGATGNWISEPTGVMVRRRVLEDVGGANPHVAQHVDFDLWMRVLARADAAFVDREVFSYRVSLAGLTGRAVVERRQWLDRVWTLEALSALPGLAEQQPQLAREAGGARRGASRQLARDVRHRVPGTRAKAASLLELARLRALRRVGRPVEVAPRIGPPAA